MKKKRIRMPEPLDIQVVNPDGSPALDDDGNQIIHKFSILTFSQNEMSRCEKFTKTGGRGMAAHVRIEDAILSAIDAGADSFVIYDDDYQLLLGHMEDPPDGQFFAQEKFGPRRMLPFVNAWLEAEDVDETSNQKAAE